MYRLYSHEHPLASLPVGLARQRCDQITFELTTMLQPIAHSLPRSHTSAANKSMMMPWFKTAPGTSLPSFHSVFGNIHVEAIRMNKPQPPRVNQIMKQSPRSKRRECMAPGCKKIRRRGGYCVRHGGGQRCSVANCGKSIQTRGLCYAHGGGQRCVVKGCKKAVKQNQMCKLHSRQSQP